MEWKSTRSGDEEEEEGEEKVGGPEIWIGIISVQDSNCQFRRHLLTSAGITSLVSFVLASLLSQTSAADQAQRDTSEERAPSTTRMNRSSYK